MDPAHLYVTVFAGDDAMGIPADEESVAIWKKLFAEKTVDNGAPQYVLLGSEENGSAMGMQGGRIFSYDVKKNWWSRAGVPSKMPAGEPGGPDSEIFYEFTSVAHDTKFGAHCHPNCDCGRFLEIGNSVFMEYKKNDDGSFSKLTQRNVDFGGGLERITAASINNADVFEIDVFEKVKDEIFILCGARYEENNNVLVVGNVGNNHGMPPEAMRRAYRVILDHVRSAIFLIADGVFLVRRREDISLGVYFVARCVFQDSLIIPEGNLSRLAEIFIDIYKNIYPNLQENRNIIPPQY